MQATKPASGGAPARSGTDLGTGAEAGLEASPSLYKDTADVGLYYNDSWTRDPTLFTGPAPAGGGAYGDARDADMTVVGADIHVRLPALGKLWLASSYIKVKQGWALSPTVEVMHSNGGAGIANNYLAFGQPGSTGSGSLFNFAWLYENSLSNVQGHGKEHPLPDLSLEFFGMLANANRDLLPGATISDSLGQFMQNGTERVDETSTRIGIRHIEWIRNGGLVINGARYKALGANLHQETYGLGNAMPDSATYYDVKRLKEGGMSFIRG